MSILLRNCEIECCRLKSTTLIHWQLNIVRQELRKFPEMTYLIYTVKKEFPLF